MKENKLVQEALIQMKQVEEAIAENAKGILASTMKEEINQLVKESLSEQDDEDEVELDADMDMSADNDEVDMDMDMDLDDESEDMEMDFDMDSDETPIDLTDASDEEILKVFKAMGEDDGIIVKKDGENVHLTDGNADVEYLVKLGESEDDMMDYDSEMMEDDMEDSEMMEETDESVDDVINAIFSGDMSGVDSEDDEDVVYEITLDDEMMEEDDMEDSEMMEEDDMEDSEMMEEDDMEDSEMMEEDDMEDLTNET